MTKEKKPLSNGVGGIASTVVGGAAGATAAVTGVNVGGYVGGGNIKGSGNIKGPGTFVFRYHNPKP